MNIFQLFHEKIDGEGECQSMYAHTQIQTNIAENLKDSRTYVVKPLDTIQSIAEQLNISPQELKLKVKSNHLFIGQKIEF